MTATRSQKPAPTETDLRKIVTALRQTIDGRTDNWGQVTLTAGATTTTYSSQNISENSTIALSPRTLNAAAAFASTYVSARANGFVTLTHANNAQTDRTFDLAWIG